MDDSPDSTTLFAGVSATPNVFTRLFDLARDVAVLTLHRAAAGRTDSPATAEGYPREPEPTRERAAR